MPRVEDEDALGDEVTELGWIDQCVHRLLRLRAEQVACEGERDNVGEESEYEGGQQV